MNELIFVADDELHIRELIQYNLEGAGYRVKCFETGSALLHAMAHETPDMVLLDILMPELLGTEVCSQIRQSEQGKDIPILFITAKSSEFDKIIGLEGGADDYITKPFSVNELIARVRAVFRRSMRADAKQHEITAGEIRLYPQKHEVYKNEKKLTLTKKEYELLKTLMQARDKVFTRDELLDRIWGYNYYGDTRTVDVHIRQLRKQLDDTGEEYIETVRGVGYKFIK